MVIQSDFLHNSLRNYLRQSLHQTEKERRCRKERKRRKIIYALRHSIASKLWTDYSLGRSRNEPESEKVAGKAGRGKGSTHIHSLLMH